MHKLRIDKMKKIVILILINTNYLTAQDTNNLAIESTYEIIDTESSSDTILTEEIKYDASGRKVKQTIFRKHQFENYYNDVVEYQYFPDKTVEIHRTTDHDTFKILTTQLNGNKEIEDRNIGWWESGKYQRNEYDVIRKNRYNKVLGKNETLLYSEKGDTSYVLTYTIDESEDPFYVIKDEYNKNLHVSRYIMQYDEDIGKQIDCTKNCTKRIFFKSDSTISSNITFDGSLIIEAEDTTKLYVNQITKLKNDYQIHSRERYDYLKPTSTKEVTYYDNKEKQYLKEWYTFHDRWLIDKCMESDYSSDDLITQREYEYENDAKIISKEIKYNWNESRTKRTQTSKSYKSGEIKKTSIEFTKYQYR
jgi:hypothetical protein